MKFAVDDWELDEVRSWTQLQNELADLEHRRAVLRNRLAAADRDHAALMRRLIRHAVREETVR